jgi:hypothetical protein
MSGSSGLTAFEVRLFDWLAGKVRLLILAVKSCYWSLERRPVLFSSFACGLLRAFLHIHSGNFAVFLFSPRQDHNDIQSTIYFTHEPVYLRCISRMKTC